MGTAMAGTMGGWRLRLQAASAAAWSFALAGQAAAAAAAPGIFLPGRIPLEFAIFAAILIGIALYHHHTFAIAVGGLAVVIAYKLGVTGFSQGPGLSGLLAHFRHEWVTLANLFCLLLGFAILARHFQMSRLPDVMPAVLPDGWTGGLALLIIVFVLSAFLDNIAAALIGGAMASRVFRGRLHIGFIAAIVAASNAGGAGSVVGDTTTTMMWISGIPPLTVFKAYSAAVVAVLVCGIPASLQQHAYSPIVRHADPAVRIDWTRVAIVLTILVVAVLANVTATLYARDWLDRIPMLGIAVWIAILLTAPLRRPDWRMLPANLSGTIFLLSLVAAASLMPVESLPAASWQTAFGLGMLSAVFDNIPLTALSIAQGGYDWGVLAYAVGFGGSMIWFGSSAGVALCNMFPECRSVGAWLRGGWHVALAYMTGFAVMLWTLGWTPDPRVPPPSRAPAAHTVVRP